MIDEQILAIDGWMTPEELEWLANTASKLPGNSLVVEVGSWLGRSTSAIWKGSRGNIRLVCVDTWKGQPDLQETDHKLASEIDLQQQFLINMDNMGAAPTLFNGMPTTPGLYYITGDSVESAKLFDDHSIEWLFDDGDHTRLGEDIDAYKSKMKENSLLTGHDYFCFFEYIQKDIHERFYINGLCQSIWIKHWPAYPPEWY